MVPESLRHRAPGTEQGWLVSLPWIGSLSHKSPAHLAQLGSKSAECLNERFTGRGNGGRVFVLSDGFVA